LLQVIEKEFANACIISILRNYNDNRKSKFLNFDRKAKLSEQISTVKFVDFCCNDIDAKSRLWLFARLMYQP
jgi:hypothetical protein